MNRSDTVNNTKLINEIEGQNKAYVFSLLESIKTRNVEIVELLLKKTDIIMIIMKSTNSGKSAFRVAVESGDPEVVKPFIKIKINETVEIENNVGNQAIIQYFIENDTGSARINQTKLNFELIKDRNYEFVEACRYNDIEKVIAFINDHEFDPNVESKLLYYYETPEFQKIENRLHQTFGLFEACLMNNIEIVSLLIKHPKIDVNKKRIIENLGKEIGFTFPLIEVCKRDHFEIAQFLLSHPSIDAYVASSEKMDTFINNLTPMKLASIFSSRITKILNNGSFKIEQINTFEFKEVID